MEFKCINMNKPLWCAAISLIFGVIFAFSGILIITGGPVFYDRLLASQLLISEETRSYNLWKSTPIPVYIQFYMYNWTNPKDIENKTTKPILSQMGPYRFNEYQEKINITFNQNNTISYREVKYWLFDPENSNGTLDDLVTTLNIPPLSASFVAREWSFLTQTSMSLTINQLETRHVTKTVREFLFEGYEDPLINLAGKFPGLSNMKIPFDKFGWFYKRNNSDEFGGHYNMDTGADDISKVGKIRYWNYSNRTNFFQSHCGEVNGSAGGLWPPGQNKTSISMFSPDLCRSITFKYSEDIKVHDILGYQFVGGREIIDNGTVDPNNACFCNGECLPVGVVNASSCRFGAPAFVSYPHFYLADPYYASLVEGLSPEKEKHQFSITLEPTTGIPLEVTARFQINILLQPSVYISMYKKVPRIFFPVIWFEQKATMSEELADDLKQLLELPDYFEPSGTILAILGVTLIIVSIGISVYLCTRKQKHHDKTVAMARNGDIIIDDKGLHELYPLQPPTTNDNNYIKSKD